MSTLLRPSRADLLVGDDLDDTVSDGSITACYADGCFALFHLDTDWPERLWAHAVALAPTSRAHQAWIDGVRRAVKAADNRPRNTVRTAPPPPATAVVDGHVAMYEQAGVRRPAA